MTRKPDLLPTTRDARKASLALPGKKSARRGQGYELARQVGEEALRVVPVPGVILTEIINQQIFNVVVSRTFDLATLLRLRLRLSPKPNGPTAAEPPFKAGVSPENMRKIAAAAGFW